MKEEDVAKVAFATIVRAIDNLRSEDTDYKTIEYPTCVYVNGHRYDFLQIIDKFTT